MGKEEVTDKLASGTISRRGALKLLGGAAVGLLVLPAFPSTASAAGKLQPPLKRSSLGTFGGVKYVQYDGLFVGKTSTGNYRVPYRISTPANPRRANRSSPAAYVSNQCQSNQQEPAHGQRSTDRTALENIT